MPHSVQPVTALASGTKPAEAKAAAPLLRVRNLHKRYGDVAAVSGIDIDVWPGECVGLLGTNGAGKTTTIEICEGLHEPDTGVVEVLGMSWSSARRRLRHRVGVSLQETQFSGNLTVRETLDLFASFHPQPHATSELLFELELNTKSQTRVSGLSGGQKQRLALACALVGRPDLLFLDEPTTGLDPQSRRKLWEVIADFRSSGRGVIITTHYMDEAERICDRVAIMDRGRFVALGTPRELIAQLGAEHVIEFMTDQGELLDSADLMQLTGVSSVHCGATSYTLKTSRLHQTIPALLSYLLARRRVLKGMHTHSISLEDVFIALTGRTLERSTPCT